MNLVLRFSALGDVVLCSAFTQALEGETLFVTSPSLKPFVEESFSGRMKVYGIERPKAGLLGWFFAGLRFSEFLRLYAAPRIDVLKIWDLHNVSKSLFFSWGLIMGLERSRIVARIQVRRTPKERLRRWMLLIFKKDIKTHRSASELRVFERHLELLETPSKSPEPRLVSNPRREEFRPGSRSLRILVAPDAQHWKKIWPVDNWKLLLVALAKLETLHIHVTLVGNRTWIDDAWIRGTLLRDHPQFSIENLQSRTSLTELASLASDHHLALTSNSAWQHIAEAVGTPTLSLAGPIAPEFGFSPWRRDSRELSVELGCRPCTLHGDGICYRLSEHHACMKRLSPRRVLQEMWQMLGYGSPPG